MLKSSRKICKTCKLPKFIWSEGSCKDCCKSGFKSLSSKSILRSFSKMKSKPKAKSPEVVKFYKSQVEKYQDKPTSFESASVISYVSAVNIAHIFPKETYKSIATHPDNIILLTWQEHTRFDELLSRHDFDKLEKEFKSWGAICEIIKLLMKACEEQGNLKKALEDYLNTK